MSKKPINLKTMRAPLGARSIHGTSISVDGGGALIVGPSGAGKSSLAYSLVQGGADLVSDDLTLLRIQQSAIFLECPNPDFAAQLYIDGTLYKFGNVVKSAKLKVVISLRAESVAFCTIGGVIMPVISIPPKDPLMSTEALLGEIRRFHES